MPYKDKEKYNEHMKNYLKNNPEQREKHKQLCKDRRERIKKELRKGVLKI